MIPFQMMQIGKIQAEQERARVVKLTEEAQMRKQVEDTKRVLVG